MQNFRNLHVWQKAHQLALTTYEVPAYLLKPEAWPLRDQILRAAISIPSNVAEGAGRGRGHFMPGSGTIFPKCARCWWV